MGTRLITAIFAVAPLLAQSGAASGIKVPDWVRVEANISYDQYPQTVLDIMRPGEGALEKRPGVIVIHGGGWVGGNKESMIQQFCLRYLKKGFVVCNVEYRLAGVAPAPAAVIDVLKAAAWFRHNAKRYDVDPKRIVVTGDSAGGHLALMVGMTPKGTGLGPPVSVAAVVNWYGITDVAELLAGETRRDYAVRWLPEQAGRMALARRLSPITYVRKNVPAILTIQGDADPVVPYEQGTRLTRALRDAGADAELISVRGGGHGGFGAERMDKLYRSVFRFLKRRKVMR